MKYLTAEQVLFIHARLVASNQELEDFTLQCAQHLVSQDQMIQWVVSQAESVG